MRNLFGSALFLIALGISSCSKDTQEILLKQSLVFTGDSRFCLEIQKYRTQYNINPNDEAGDFFQNRWADNGRVLVNYAGPGYHPSSIIGQVNTILAQKPDKIFIQCGAADLLNPAPNPMPDGSWHQFLSAFASVPVVFVTEPINFRDDAAYSVWNSSLAWQQNYNDSLRRLVLAYPNVKWVPMNNQFCYESGYMKPEYSHTDGIHNSYKGYKLMMEILDRYANE